MFREAVGGCDNVVETRDVESFTPGMGVSGCIECIVLLCSDVLVVLEEREAGKGHESSGCIVDDGEIGKYSGGCYLRPLQ